MIWNAIIDFSCSLLFENARKSGNGFPHYAY
jgi:hypothetical protein